MLRVDVMAQRLEKHGDVSCGSTDSKPLRGGWGDGTPGRPARTTRPRPTARFITGPTIGFMVVLPVRFQPPDCARRASRSHRPGSWRASVWCWTRVAKAVAAPGLIAGRGWALDMETVELNELKAVELCITFLRSSEVRTEGLMIPLERCTHGTLVRPP